MSVDGDDEDYQSQADTVLDADRSDDLDSVSTMVIDQRADQNPGDSVVYERKNLQEEKDLEVQGIAPPTEDSLL
jgi:hypothetical protein